MYYTLLAFNHLKLFKQLAQEPHKNTQPGGCSPDIAHHLFQTLLWQTLYINLIWIFAIYSSPSTFVI